MVGCIMMISMILLPLTVLPKFFRNKILALFKLILSRRIRERERERERETREKIPQSEWVREFEWTPSPLYLCRTFLLRGREEEPWSSGYGRRLMSKGCEFESRHRILDGHFSHLFAVKIVMCVWKDKNKWKRGRVGPFWREEEWGLRECESE